MNSDRTVDLEILESDGVKPPIVIEQSLISEEILHSIADDFVLREGTDYGLIEFSTEQKRSKILKQIKAEKILIVFDPNSESVTLINVADYKRLVNII